MNDGEKIRKEMKYESIWRVFEPGGISPTLDTMQGGNREPKIIQRPRGYNLGGEHRIAPTVTSNSYQDNNYLKVVEATNQGYARARAGDGVNFAHHGSKTRRGRVGDQIATTLMTGNTQGVVTEDLKIRKLTPRECWRLQGFPDWAFDRAASVNSNSQLYKQAGNSVTVPVIRAIAERLETEDKYRKGYAYRWHKHDNEYYEEYANVVELEVEGSYLVNDPTYCHAHRACITSRGKAHGGPHTIYRFVNGYGASVVCHEYSQGVELAVVDSDLNIVYDTPITDDVVSYIKTEEELKDILSRIKELEARPNET